MHHLFLPAIFLLTLSLSLHGQEGLIPNQNIDVSLQSIIQNLNANEDMLEEYASGQNNFTALLILETGIIKSANVDMLEGTRATILPVRIALDQNGKVASFELGLVGHKETSAVYLDETSLIDSSTASVVIDANAFTYVYDAINPIEQKKYFQLTEFALYRQTSGKTQFAGGLNTSINLFSSSKLNSQQFVSKNSTSPFEKIADERDHIVQKYPLEIKLGGTVLVQRNFPMGKGSQEILMGVSLSAHEILARSNQNLQNEDGTTFDYISQKNDKGLILKFFASGELGKMFNRWNAELGIRLGPPVSTEISYENGNENLIFKNYGSYTPAVFVKVGTHLNNE